MKREELLELMRKHMMWLLDDNPGMPEEKIIWYLCIYCQEYDSDLPLESINEVFQKMDEREEEWRKRRERALHG